MKTLTLLSALLLAGFAGANSGAFAETLEAENLYRKAPDPINGEPPQFPMECIVDATAQVDEYVELLFTINEMGTVQDPSVLRSSNPCYERAALRALLKWKYKPLVVDGYPVMQPDVFTRMTFQLNMPAE